MNRPGGWFRPVAVLAIGSALVVLALGCASGPSDDSSEPETVARRGERGGKAEGTFVVSDDPTAFEVAYLVRLRPRRSSPEEFHLILADRLIPADVLDDPRRLTAFASDRAVRAVELVTSLEGRAIETRFHHDGLPAGLSVTGAPKELRLVGLPDGPVTGSFVFDDGGASSWSARARFETRVRRVEPKRLDLPADAAPAERARAELEADGIEFTESRFLDRCFDGDLDAVKLFLEAGMSPRTRAGRGSALGDAISGKHTAVARVLLAAGADPNEKPGKYETELLLRAVDTGDPDLVRAMLEAGANPSMANEYRITPLMSASLEGRLEIVRLLIAHGAKVTARDTAGGTALSSAVFRGHLEVARELIAAGADVVRDRTMLLDLARQEKNKAMEKLVLGAAAKGAAKGTTKAKPKPKPKPKGKVLEAEEEPRPKVESEEPAR